MADPIRSGGIREVSDVHEAEHEFIRAAIAKTGEHANREYKVIRATRQTVAGTRHDFIITFNDDESQQEYRVTAWSRPWLTSESEALQLTFEKHEKKN